MYRRNSDIRLRDLERQISQGDMSVMPAYLQALVRTRQMLPDNLELAAILDYAPAVELVGNTIKFCDNPSSSNGWWRITWDQGLTPTLLVFIGDWYLEHLSAPSSDAYFNAIQTMIPRFQKAYQDGKSVNGYDGGFLQELAYGAEGSVVGILWFIYNSCEFFDGASINLDADQLESHSRMAIHWALKSISSISYKSFCAYIQNKLLEFILPEICHPTIWKRNPRVYHRSPKRDITKFDPTKMRFGDYGPGFYFAEEHEGVQYAGHHLYTADVYIENPLDVENATPEEIERLRRAMRIEEDHILIDDPTPPAIQIFGLIQTLWDAGLGYQPQAVIKVLKALGYDGIVVPSKGYWVAFDPDQIILTK